MRMPADVKVLIIGGGVTGLCAATYAVKAFGPENVLLLEASDYVGGQTGTTREDGFSCDWGPNGFLDREPKTLEWVEELGLTGALQPCDAAAAHRFILKNDQLVEIVGPPRFLLAPLLSVRGRLRLLCEPLVPAKRDDEPESIWQFAARRIGREAADTLVTPMVSGVFGGDAHALELAQCFPRMAAMEREHGSLFKALRTKRKQNPSASAAGPAGTLTSFRDGIGQLPRTAAEQLADCIEYDTAVVSVTGESGAFKVTTQKGTVVNAENVICATPAYASAAMVREWDQDLAEALDAIPYAGIAVLCTGYAREKVGHDLDGFGFLVPRNQGKRVLGSIWTSSVFPGRAPEGYVQLRTMYGGYTDPEAVNLTDKELLELLAREVHPLLDIAGQPDFVQIFRWKRGIPQYTIGHHQRLNAIEAGEQRHRGLYFAGNSYRGVSLNDCVLSARRAVEAVTG
jgi:oxygen-dependent protoporphyrinogen oxidase